jgi:hypothetical protein
MGAAWACVNQTRPHCVNKTGNTHSKPLAAQHGRGTAWAPHAMCELALRGLLSRVFVPQQCGLTLSNLCILEFKYVNTTCTDDGHKTEYQNKLYAIDHKDKGT